MPGYLKGGIISSSSSSSSSLGLEVERRLDSSIRVDKADSAIGTSVAGDPREDSTTTRLNNSHAFKNS